MLRIGIPISSTELGVILLSVVQKVGHRLVSRASLECGWPTRLRYHRATDDQKAVQAFVLGMSFYKQRATVHHEALGLHESNKELEFHG